MRTFLRRPFAQPSQRSLVVPFVDIVSRVSVLSIRRDATDDATSTYPSAPLSPPTHLLLCRFHPVPYLRAKTHGDSVSSFPSTVVFPLALPREATAASRK